MGSLNQALRLSFNFWFACPQITLLWIWFITIFRTNTTSKHFNFRPSQKPVPARQCIPPSPPSLEATGRSHQTTRHRFFGMLASHFTFHLHAYLLEGEQTPRTSQINTGTFALQAELSISPTYWWNISSSRKLPDSEAAPAAKGSHCCVCTLTCNSQKSSFFFQCIS